MIFCTVSEYEKTNGSRRTESGRQYTGRAEIEFEKKTRCVFTHAWPAQVSRRRREMVEIGMRDAGTIPEPLKKLQLFFLQSIFRTIFS
jgi:hypothetical protein